MSPLKRGFQKTGGGRSSSGRTEETLQAKVEILVNENGNFNAFFYFQGHPPKC